MLAILFEPGGGERIIARAAGWKASAARRIMAGMCSLSAPSRAHRRPGRLAAAGAALAVSLLTACGTLPRPPPAPAHHLAAGGETAACASLFAAQDAAVAAAVGADAQSARVPGFPYLRVHRFLAAVTPAAASPQLAGWAERLRRLDAEARALELANAGRPADAAAVERCGRLLLAADLARPERRRALVAAARVPDDYVTALRVAGLYPLSSIPFMAGVHALHEQTRERFAARAAATRAAPALRWFVPPGSASALMPAEAAAMLQPAADDPLAVPEPAAADRVRLLRHFAPALAVAGSAPHDRIGAPRHADGDAAPAIDVGDPVLYTLTAHTRFDGRNLLQLVYVAWFPERPLAGPFDLLGGKLDGVVWRVTLDHDGQPLLYDAMHACGCYHMAFPTARLRPREPAPSGWQEPMLVPARAPEAAGGLSLWLQSGTHYLEAVRPPAYPADATVYRLADYDRLRSLPLPAGGRRSLFDPHGLVPGTERAERWLFWPMGVAEPGAMRQWGNHAIAFVGRRHFDDADLLQRWFERVRAP